MKCYNKFCPDRAANHPQGCVYYPITVEFCESRKAYNRFVRWLKTSLKSHDSLYDIGGEEFHLGAVNSFELVLDKMREV